MERRWHKRWISGQNVRHWAIHCCTFIPSSSIESAFTWQQRFDDRAHVFSLINFRSWQSRNNKGLDSMRNYDTFILSWWNLDEKKYFPKCKYSQIRGDLVLQIVENKTSKTLFFINSPSNGYSWIDTMSTIFLKNFLLPGWSLSANKILKSIIFLSVSSNEITLHVNETLDNAAVFIFPSFQRVAAYELLVNRARFPRKRFQLARSRAQRSMCTRSRRSWLN